MLLDQVRDDEEEVRLAQAQVLMDCAADLMSQKGLDGTRAWCDGGLKLRLEKNAKGTDTWIVFGQLPQDEGQGTVCSLHMGNTHIGILYIVTQRWQQLICCQDHHHSSVVASKY